MANVGIGHVTIYQDCVQVVRADRRMEHGPTPAGPDNPEITGTRRVSIAVTEEEEAKERIQQEKCHLFPLLSLSFFSLSFLAESICFVNPFVFIHLLTGPYISTFKSRAAFS